MSNVDQIKPVDWAKEHGVKSDFVMKLLRDNGVKVLTQVSKVNAAEFEKIEEAVAAEKAKMDARSKNLKKPAASDAGAAAPAEKKKTASLTTTKNGVKVSLKRATTKKADDTKTTAKATVKTAAKPAAAKPAAEAPKAPEAPADEAPAEE